MEQTQPYYKCQILCCINTRPADAGRASCGDDGKHAVEIHAALKDYVAANGLKQKVRVSKTFCQDLCAKGPIVTIVPDNITYSKVTIEDVPTIIERHVQPFMNI